MQLPVSGDDAVIVLLSAVVVLLAIRLNVAIPPVALPGTPSTEQTTQHNKLRGASQRAQPTSCDEVFLIVLIISNEGQHNSTSVIEVTEKNQHTFRICCRTASCDCGPMCRSARMSGGHGRAGGGGG